MLKNTVITAKFLIFCTLLLAGCAKERPVKYVLTNGRRLPKTAFKQTFLFQKTITQIKYAGNTTENIPPGIYEVSNKLIQFELREKSLDILAIDPLFKEEKAALRNSLLASFEIRHVDVLRKQNSEGQDTSEEEETDTRRPWKERSLIVIEPTKDSQDSYARESSYSITPEHIDIDPNTGAINIDVTHQLKDETQLSLRYSFLPFQVSPSYKAKHYAEEVALRFGFFNTTSLSFDKYGRVLGSAARNNTVINRWDTSKPVVYYFSKDFPNHLKPAAAEVFNQWNTVFKVTTGKTVLELRENSGQEIGDLRFNMIHYDSSIDASHGVIGYGPTYANPRTGEIIKGDVLLYGGILKALIARERSWAKLLDTGSKSSRTQNLSVSSSPVKRSLIPATQFIFQPQATQKLLKPVNSELVQLMTGNHNSLKTLSTARGNLTKEGKANITRLSDSVLTAIDHGVNESELTDEELEIKILKPLLTHELGHNLGLRHNFLASADKAHYAPQSKSSSVMDYGFLTSDEPQTPGPYDVAAIEVSYGDSVEKSQMLLNENFLFCTDENVMSSNYGMCHQFDSGSTLSEIIQSHFNRYMASWALNNLKNDRVYFNSPRALSKHIAKVQSNLIPFRMIYDNADAILRAAEEKSLLKLWSILHQQIEADNNSDLKTIITIKIPKGVNLSEAAGGLSIQQDFLERKIDPNKIPALVSEAKRAKVLAYQALMTVILNSSRPDYDSENSLTSELDIRGVIYDKIIALQLAGFQTPDPLGGNSSVSLFSSSEGGEFKKFLVTLLSDTAISDSDPTLFQLAPSDTNLKEIALHIISNELSVSGSDVSSRKLLQVNQMVLEPTSPLLTADFTHRKKIQDLFKQLFKIGINETEREVINSKLNLAQAERNKSTSIAVTPAFKEGNLYYVAPVHLPELGLDSAAGHLIRDNLNTLEDMIEALKTLVDENKQVIEAESKKPEGQRDSNKLIEAIGAIESYLQAQRSLHQITDSERLFLEKFYKISNYR